MASPAFGGDATRFAKPGGEFSNARTDRGPAVRLGRRFWPSRAHAAKPGAGRRCRCVRSATAGVKPCERAQGLGAGGGERFDNLAAIVADLSRRSRVLLIAVSPDGRSLASGSEDKTIHLWDLTTGKELRRLQGHTAPVWSVAFAPDGRSLASGSDDKTIRLWDLASGKELRRLEGHTGTVYSVAFAPDGRSLASGSEDNTIRLWDLAGGKELRRLEGHTGTV